MVMAAVSVLAIVVTEFSYIAQVNERMAYDSMDQVKAHYLAKAGVKLSLLRLKAYAQLRQMTGGGSSGGAAGSNPLAGAIPKSVMDKVWNFPFMYPLPSLPDMTMGQRDQIAEFTKGSSLEGKYTAVIQSESSKFNLNSILQGFQGTPASVTPAPSNSSSSPPATPPPSTPPSAAPSFDPVAARKSLHDYLQDLMQGRFDTDDDFAREYRDYKLDDLVNYIALWADRSYVTNVNFPEDVVQPKRAPFYSMTELHLIPTLDDDLYNLFSDGLTVARTPGININTMQDATLRGLIPQMNKDEVAEFFKFRDDTTVDNTFKKETDFWDYITKNVSAFRSDANQVNTVKTGLTQRGIRLVVDETEFKITVQATVNQAVRTFEVWVTLIGTGATPAFTTPGSTPSSKPSTPPLSGPGAQQTPVPDSGLRINFMRVL